MSRFRLTAAAAAAPAIFLLVGSFSLLSSAALAMEMPDAHEHTMFHPLSCNSDLTALTSPTDCAVLSAFLNATDLSSDAEVVVPCGACVVADYDVLGGAGSSVIDLRKGLNIEGLLHFPPPPAGQSIRIRTPHVVVQGELRIDSPGEVIPVNGPGGDVPIEFVMVGSTDVLFAPHADNAMACMKHGGSCNIGKKPIAIAGGKLSIDAMPSASCPSWTKLADVGPSGPIVIAPEDLESAPQPPSDTCPSIIIDEDFAGTLSEASASGVNWDGFCTHWDVTQCPTAGVETVGSDSYFSVSDRKSSHNSPRVSLPVSCLAADVPYLLSYTYRLRHDTETAFTPPYLKMVYQFASGGNLQWSNPTYLYPRGGTASVPEGQWQTVQQVLVFPTDLADSSEVSEIYLYLADLSSVYADVTVDLDSFKLELAPAGLYDADGSQVCSSLIRNGAAGQANGHTHPFYAPNGILSTVSDMVDGPSATPSLPYFRSTARSSKWSALISQDLQYGGCSSPGQVYDISFEYRTHSTDERYVHASINADFEDDPARDNSLGIVQCPPSSGNWVSCAGRFTMTEEQAGASLLSFDMYLAGEDFSVDVDVADIKVDIVTERSAVSSLVLEDSASSSCWGPGAEILITSHTIRSDDSQIAKIVSVEAGGQINLDRPIYRPVTMVDDPNTATEVALLSRNVKFSAVEDDPNPLHGGHLIVLHTPMVAQMLGGVEVVGFGQQGKMGRYPIHFHMSNSAMGSVVSSNTIRDSKQRCLVLHNTDDVMVKDNVAYNTKGHCYILEDGSEQNNTLLNNLAVLQSPVDVRISDNESDHLPSSFWLLNPQNTFVGNVAAGSSHSGFWFEVQARVRGKSQELHPDMQPNTLPLKEFRDNISHSNGFKGLHTYPQTGYRPTETAVFSNHKSYRNGGDGVFFHAGGNLKIDGGYFADNKVAIEIDLDHSDHIANAVVVGRSPVYQDILDSYGDAIFTYPQRTHCRKEGGEGLTGIIVDTYHWGGPSATGTEIDNILFSGFADDACPGSPSVALTAGHHNKQFFDPRNSLNNIVFADDSNKISFCESTEGGIENVAIRDVDGSFSGTGVSSFYVSDNDRMAADPRCSSVEGTCAALCQDMCIRKVAVFVSSYAPDDLRFEVSGTNDVGETLPTTTFSKLVTYKESDATDWDSFHKIYVSLPAGGSYNARFVTESIFSEAVWPVFADVRYEDYPNQCGPDFAQLTIEQPDRTCSELIVNGNMEDASGAGSIEGWWHIAGGLILTSGGADGTDFALTNADRRGSYDGIAQYLDTRCMVEGEEYRFSAKIKLMKDGDLWKCNPSSGSNQADSCPSATLRSSYGVNRDSDWQNIGRMLTGDQEWNLMEGSLTVRNFDADAGFTAVYISGAPDGVDIIIDSVSMVPVTAAPTTSPSASPSSSPTTVATLSPTLSNPPDLFSINTDATDKVSFAPDGVITFATQSGGNAAVITKEAHKGIGPSGEIDFVVELQSREIYGTGYQSGLAIFFAPEDSSIHHVATSDNQYNVFEQNVVSTLNEKIYPSIAGNWLYWRSKTAPDGTSVQQNSRSDQKMEGFYRLRRIDGKAHSYYSADGSTWTEIGNPFVLPDEYKMAPLKIGARVRNNWMTRYEMSILPTITSDGPASAAGPGEADQMLPSFDAQTADFLDTVSFGPDGIVKLAKSDSSGLESAVVTKSAHSGVGSEGDLELLVEITNKQIFGTGYQAGVALFFATSDKTLQDVSPSSYGSFEANVVSTVREKIYPSITTATWFNLRSIDPSGLQAAPSGSANYQMKTGFLKLERKNGVVTASQSHHNAIWTPIGSPVELPPELKNAPLKLGMRISRNWNSLYDIDLKPTITSGGAVEANG